MVTEPDNRSVAEIDVGQRWQLFLSPWHFVLANLHLELGKRLDVEETVAQDQPVGGRGVGQDGKVVVLAVVALEPKTGAANHERVRPRTVAVEGPIVSLDVSIRLNLEFAVGALDVKVLVAPPRGYCRSGFFLFSRLGRRRRLRGRGCSALHQRGVQQLRTLRRLGSR